MQQITLDKPTDIDYGKQFWVRLFYRLIILITDLGLNHMGGLGNMSLENYVILESKYEELKTKITKLIAKHQETADFHHKVANELKLGGFHEDAAIVDSKAHKSEAMALELRMLLR